MIVQAAALALAFHLALGATPPASQGDAKGEGKELAELKKQRDLADAFMRRVTEQALKALDQEKAAKEAKKGERKLVRESLQAQLKQKHFFKTGDDPAAFQRGLKAADQEGIKLDNAAVHELIKASVFQRVDDKTIKSLAAEVGKEHAADADAVLRAVAAEYRVRIANDLKAKKK